MVGFRTLSGCLRGSSYLYELVAKILRRASHVRIVYMCVVFASMHCAFVHIRRKIELAEHLAGGIVKHGDHGVDKSAPVFRQVRAAPP
eukprot:3574500-Pyramimonas_sp.AAC.1